MVVSIFFPPLMPVTASGHIIQGSALFDGSSGRLGRTFDAGSNRKKFTLNAVTKINNPTSGYPFVFSAHTSNTNQTSFRFDPNGKLTILDYVNSAYPLHLITTQQFRDPSSYYDITYSYDSTVSTPSSSSIRLFVNGVQITDFDTENYPSQNAESFWGTSGNLHQLGAQNAGNYSSSYFARFVYINDAALDPTSFGETSEDGFWQLNDISELTFGANGFVIEGSAIAAGTDSNGTNQPGATPNLLIHSNTTNNSTTAVNSGADGSAVTMNGNTKHVTAQKVFGTSSILFPGSSGDYVSIPDTAATEMGARDFTIECRVRLDAVDSYQRFVSKYNTATSKRTWSLSFSNDGSLIFQVTASGGTVSISESWSPSADTWYALRVTRGGGKIQLYVDGTRLGSGTANTTTVVDNDTPIELGSRNLGTADLFAGHMDEVMVLMGTALTTAASYTVPTLAYDVGNSFLKTGSIISTSDSPTNSDDGYGNYCNFNALVPASYGNGTVTYTNGNRTAAHDGTMGGGDQYWGSTLQIPLSGKYHIEFTCTALGAETHAGIYISFGAQAVNGLSSAYQAQLLKSAINTRQFTGSLNAYSGLSVNDRITFDLDIDNSIAKLTKNGSLIDTVTSVAWSDEINISFYGVGGAANRSSTWVMNTGQSTFTDTPVSGHVGLATQNLPTPINPDDHFFSEVVTHNGTSTAATCTFNLDTYEWLAIIKNTTGAVEKWYWIDSLNGVNKYWSSNANTAISSDANVLSVSGTQFSLGSSLGAKKYLVEFHRAGLASATAANTAGSLHSTKTSFNTESGFEIHLYEGTGANATLGNPLSKALDFMIAKRLDGTDRALAWHKDLDTPTTGYLDLATTAPEANHASIWNSTIPTATLISLGTNSNVNNAGTQVLFGWHSVDSYSLFWRHEGTANASGPFINTGSYPNVILTKDIDTAADSWYYFNEALSAPNQWGYPLLLQATNVPVDNSALDAVSNGIKLRSTNSPNVASSYVGAMWGGRPIQGDGKINQGRAR